MLVFQLLRSESALKRPAKQLRHKTAREKTHVLRLVMTFFMWQSAATPFKAQKQQVNGGKLFGKSV
jgi:hypothetical protein